MLSATVLTLCMASMAYYEARGEGIDGMTAVMEVAMHRAESPRYPNEVCAVVKQDRQFSAFNDGYKMEVNQELLDILPYAWKVYRGAIDNIPDTVLHYHAKSVNPKWASTGVLVSTINNHMYYSGVR
ncbi:MAG: cell wall hydrolase [Thiomicrorhabdus sp.]|jgi:spore germination cell wall hydrolase CwlJ-like protein|nr:cell wall hydrolase [Thiomicrorhabdus sp.]